MGLSERKAKQKIGNDPRNLGWSKDAVRFGHTYLAKLGWSPSTGLGASGEGRTTHIAVAQKLDQAGIGANVQPGGPDAIAWKQNKDFEGVLERLNQTNIQSDTLLSDADAKESRPKSGQTEMTELANKKEKKKGKKSKAKDDKPQATLLTEVLLEGSSDTSLLVSSVGPPKPLRMAHRAKFKASKRMAASSPAALSEILGISVSASASPTPTPTSHTPTLTPISDTPVNDLITSSTTSVADYFKQKMQSRSGAPSSLSVVTTRNFTDDADELPRTGLGLGSRPFIGHSKTPPQDVRPKLDSELVEADSPIQTNLTALPEAIPVTKEKKRKRKRTEEKEGNKGDEKESERSKRKRKQLEPE